MKIPTPIITLLVGMALAIALLVSSMSAVSEKKAAAAQASANAAASAVPPVTSSSAGSTAAASGSHSASASASASATGSFVIPPHANYDGEVQGNLGDVAVAVHDTFAIAYFCNGSTQEGWFSGTPHDGQLSMTGQ